MRIDPYQINIQISQIKRQKQEAEKALSQTEHQRRVEAQKLREIEGKEEAILRQLRQRDREVRAHEMAHLAAAGPYALSGARFEMLRGPDGRLYAVAGEVSIDTSPESDPRQTLEKARVIRRAALAPAHPSSQDRMVAMKAAQMEAQALAEIARERLEEARSGEAGRQASRAAGAPPGPGAGSIETLEVQPDSEQVSRAIRAYRGFLVGSAR